MMRQVSTYQLLLLGLISQGIGAERTCCLLHIVDTLLHPFDVLQPELSLDDLHVAQRVHVSLDMNDFRVVESPDNLEDAVDSTDMREEGVAETSSGGCTLIWYVITGRTAMDEEVTHGSQSSNVDACEESRDAGCRLVHAAEPLEALVRDRYTSLFRLLHTLSDRRSCVGNTSAHVDSSIREVCSLAKIWDVVP
jgi:hypothetical protein